MKSTPQRDNETALLSLHSYVPVSHQHKQRTADTIENVFQNFKAAYEKSKNFSAEFEETTLRAGNRSTARGRLMFSKPNLLRKKYVSHRDPTQLAQLIVLDGEYSWVIYAVTQPSQ